MLREKRMMFMVVLGVMLLIFATGCGEETSTSKELGDEGETEETDEATNEEGVWEPDEIEIILSHDTGSNHDALTRELGKYWSEDLGVNFIYNNVAGASGRVGYDSFQGAKGSEEGLSILSSNIASASMMYAEQEPDWDWEETLQPLGLFGIDPGTIFVQSESEFETIEELIEEAQERPVTVAISYWNSPDNLFLHQVMDETGAQFEIIPVESGSEIITQVLGGHIEAGFSKVSGVERGGGDDLRHLAISMPNNPVPNLTNDAPTFDEVYGTDTLAVASYRAIMIKKAFVEQYPERYEKLKESFEATKVDERYVEGAEGLGLNPDLIPDESWDSETIMEIIRDYWDAHSRFGDEVFEDE